ncbi:hypothetical protein ABIA32_002770 [Streptacidiphilus sp. MAP12-20]|uniref:hypothetical protein n=1 Tax=Streptacidiphilus sp. MAP12-20 TaxID=3156299 RepID=UPI003516A47C
MTELHFSNRGRPRPRLAQLATVLVVCTVQVVILIARMGSKGIYVALALALLVLLLCVVQRHSSTGVGPEGITVDWGLGRGRTFGWQEIRWIEVRTNRTQYGTSLTVRITLSSGRRRSLPAVSSSELYPDPDLSTKFEQIVAYWELHSDAATRLTAPPRRGWRLRLRGLGLAALAVACLGLAVSAGVSAAGQASAAHAYEAVPGCGGPVSESPTFCFAQNDARVVSTSAQSTPFGTSAVTVRQADGLLWTARFGASNGLTEEAHSGDPVFITMNADVTAVTEVRYQGRTYPTMEAPELWVTPPLTALIAFAGAALLCGAWAVASRRRRPGTGYPWWAPLLLPAVVWTFIISFQSAAAPAPLGFGPYLPGLLLLTAGWAAAVLLGRRRRRLPASGATELG